MATATEHTTDEKLRLSDLDSSLVSFEPFDLPSSNQRVLGPPHPKDTVTPSLHVSQKSQNPTLDAIVETIKSLQEQDGTFTQKVARHGVLLFRGLPVQNAEDFSKFAHAFGYKPHEVIGIVVDKPLLAPNVAPASEAPKEVLIYSHNESPQVPHAPQYIFFYGHRAPSKGGESPISSSLELFHRVQLEVPEFIAELVDKGILSRVICKYEKQYEGGSTLKQAFGKEILEGDSEETKRRKVEAQIARYGRGKYTTWEWTDDGLIMSHRLPAIRTQPETNLPTLFTGLASYWKMRQGNSVGRNKVTQQLYGDGSVIPYKYLAHLAKITGEIRVLHKWQAGDALVYDNVIAQHEREPWEGEQSNRVVLASLFDGKSVPGLYGFGD